MPAEQGMNSNICQSVRRYVSSSRCGVDVQTVCEMTCCWRIANVVASAMDVDALLTMVTALGICWNAAVEPGVKISSIGHLDRTLHLQQRTVDPLLSALTWSTGLKDAVQRCCHLPRTS